MLFNARTSSDKYFHYTQQSSYVLLFVKLHYDKKRRATVKRDRIKLLITLQKKGGQMFNLLYTYKVAV